MNLPCYRYTMVCLYTLKRLLINWNKKRENIVLLLRSTIILYLEPKIIHYILKHFGIESVRLQPLNLRENNTNY